MAAQVAFWKQLIGVALLLVTATVVWHERATITAAMGLGSNDASARITRSGRSVPVIVTPVTSAEDDLVLEAVGTGRAQRSVVLRPEAAGKVVAMPLAAGIHFQAGDVLLELDDKDERLALAVAQARLAEAQRIRDRLASLETTGTASLARLDEVRTAFEIAELEVERAREALEDRILRAPFDGVPSLPEIEVGAWINSDDAIASFDDRSIILVEFELPEGLIDRVAREMPVSATSPSAHALVFDGTIAAIDSRVAAASRTARVRVSIPNSDDRLRPGASFTIRLELEGDRYPVVPELAVQFARGTLHVWRVSDSVAERVPVRLIRRRDGNVLIDGPLNEGDLVIIEGTQRLSPGKPVEVLERKEGGTT